MVGNSNQRGVCLNQHQQTSRNIFYSSANILSLPPELLLRLCEGLNICDVLSIRSTHPVFTTLIDHHASVWATCTFMDIWPSYSNMRHFEKASQHGNIEALIKLGVAYLYNEGLPGDFEGRQIVANGEKAAELFCRIENLLYYQTRKSCAPFTWLFIRPPWAVSGACCKECVFEKMKIHCSENVSPSVELCVAQTVMLMEPNDMRYKEILQHLTRASQQGSALAQYLFWEQKYNYHEVWTVDQAVQVQSLRELREIAGRGLLNARLTLCRLYAVGKYGGYPVSKAVDYIRQFVQKSHCNDVRSVYSGTLLTESMRYILVDWLAEVASMKGFDSLMLHVAVSVVDRYLQRHHVTRAKLQLLGVSAMVLCSRYLGRDIITIREAAWLTDNTYRYEDVVRMIAEVSAVLRGQFRTPTVLDYLVILGLASRTDRHTQFMAEYFTELALLHTELSVYSHGRLAASCQLLARITLRKDTLWSCELQQFSGFTINDLAESVVHLHKKSCLEAALMDHRDIVLEAIKQRYSDDYYLRVGEIPMLSATELVAVLGSVNVFLPETTAFSFSTKHKSLSYCTSSVTPNKRHDLDIASPSRRNNGSPSRFVDCLNKSFTGMDYDREKAATPTLVDLSIDDNDEEMMEGVSVLNEVSSKTFDIDDGVIVLNKSVPLDLKSTADDEQHPSVQRTFSTDENVAVDASERHNTVLNGTATVTQLPFLRQEPKPESNTSAAAVAYSTTNCKRKASTSEGNEMKSYKSSSS